MASINSVGSKNLTSSLYNSANVISGLASGLDTEGMIEGLVESYNQKIQSLTNKATKVEWKQEAYRSIISKMYAFSNKYASYSSSTNLLSKSFFNGAVNVEALGTYASKISASGRTDSDIVIKSVSQLATSARYVTNSRLAGSTNGRHITAEESVDLTGDFTLGTLQGSLSLNYGNKTVSISFDDMADQVKGETGSEKAKNLAKLIEEKLGEQKITLSSGESVKASDRIRVDVSGGRISFSDKSSAGNNVYISSVSGTVGDVLGLDNKELDDEKDRVTSLNINSNTQFTREVDTALYLSGKSMNISLDGTSKTVTLPKVTQFGPDSYQIENVNGGYRNVSGKDLANVYTEALNISLRKEFGDKITAKNIATDGKLQLQFEAPEGSDLLINSDVGGALGIGKSSSNYLSVSKTLEDLLETDENGNLKGLTKNSKGTYDFYLNNVKIGSYDKSTTLSKIMSDINNNKEAGVKVSYSNTTRQFSFTTKDTGSEGKIEIGEGLAEAMFGKIHDPLESTKTTMGDVLGKTYFKDGGKEFSLKIDGLDFTGSDGKKTDTISMAVDQNNTIEDVVATINAKFQEQGKTGWKAVFDSETNSIVVKDDKDQTRNVTYGEGVAKDLFKEIENVGTYTAGKDAKFLVSVNGSEKEMVRGSNTSTIDGLTVTLKGTFDDKDGEGVSFNRTVDSDKIVDALRSMLADYNEMMSEIRGAYATLPYQSSNGVFKSYEPLSDEDKADMTESAIQAYEEKAKQGLLFGDNNLSNLYARMREAFDSTSAFGKELHQMGISMEYNSADGSSYLALDEKKLREVLESDPDSVMEAFTAENGVMQSLKTQLDRYGSTMGAEKGILVEQAGSALSSASLLNNTWQKQIDNIASEIESWQSKLSNRVDYYTSMFTRLEMLVNQMNSQSGALAGMMGG